MMKCRTCYHYDKMFGMCYIGVPLKSKYNCKYYEERGFNWYPYIIGVVILCGLLLTVM